MKFSGLWPQDQRICLSFTFLGTSPYYPQFDLMNNLHFSLSNFKIPLTLLIQLSFAQILLQCTDNVLGLDILCALECIFFLSVYVLIRNLILAAF